MTKPDLLIVDDDPEIREHLRWALEHLYTVHLAGNAREALSCTKRYRPGLVILDLGLPPRPHETAEGLALLEGIRAVDRAIKIIVVTGHCEQTNARQAVHRGAHDCIPKPVRLDTLTLILRRAAFVYELEQKIIVSSRMLWKRASKGCSAGVRACSTCFIRSGA